MFTQATEGCPTLPHPPRAKSALTVPLDLPSVCVHREVCFGCLQGHRHESSGFQPLEMEPEIPHRCPYPGKEERSRVKQSWSKRETDDGDQNIQSPNMASWHLTKPLKQEDCLIFSRALSQKQTTKEYSDIPPKYVLISSLKRYPATARGEEKPSLQGLGTQRRISTNRSC